MMKRNKIKGVLLLKTGTAAASTKKAPQVKASVGGAKGKLGDDDSDTSC
jgi:hypothetical protein